jgi:dTDP-4-dehydrorhamnose 3,5-epimerase-like enzyme
VTGPRLVKGGAAADDRGRVSFVNELDISDCKRVYFVENFAPGTVRAWHAHRNERKWVMVVAGAALVACVKIDDWDDPSPDAEVHRYTLDASIPSALEVPAGYANGAMSLLAGTKLMYLSDATLEQTLEDDVRFEARHWDPWGIVER